MKVLINLIGGQPVPNYLAAQEIQPDKIFNIYSEASEKIMIRLNDLLKIDLINPPLKVNAFDFNQIYNSLIKFLNEPEYEVIVNLTGGTKIMSIAAFEAAKKFNLKSIYIDSENHLLYEFYKDIVKSRELLKKINIKDYFYLHGFRNVRENKVNLSTGMNDFSKFVTSDFQFAAKVLALTDMIVSFKRKNKKTWLKEYIKLNKSQNYFKWENGSGTIHYSIKDKEYNFTFNDEKFIDYHNGKWFEQLVFNKLIESGKYDEVLMNYEIFNTEEVLINELDIVAIKNEKLDIFECKSGGLFQEDLNKLKAIKNTLGKYSNLNLITYYSINSNTENEKVVKQKLKDYNVKNYVFFRSNLNLEDNNSNTNL
jgi:hypothetical protein